MILMDVHACDFCGVEHAGIPVVYRRLVDRFAQCKRLLFELSEGYHSGPILPYSANGEAKLPVSGNSAIVGA